MKVGQHCRNHFEFESGIDEEICVGGAGSNGSGTEQCSVFESSNRTSANGNYSARIAKSPVDGGRSLRRDGIGLGVDFVIFDARGADRLKGSEPYVECNLDSFNAALADSVKNFSGEVKAGRRRGHGSPLLSINGLVALAIGKRIRSFDIRGQRDVSDAIQDSKEILLLTARKFKTNVALAELPAREHPGLQLTGFAEKQSFPEANFSPGPNQALPIVGPSGELACQQNFDTTAEEIASCGIAWPNRVSTDALSSPVKPCWKNPSVIKNEQVAGPQQLREVAEVAIGILAAGPQQMQHSGVVAGGEGLLGDKFVGKMEVEVGNQHGVRL
jgi:hypothetical protein